MLYNTHLPPTDDNEWTLAANNKPDTILNDYFSCAPKESHSQRFTRFNELPAELRWEIWQQSLQTNRLVGVGLTSDHYDEGTSLPARMPYTLKVKTRHRPNALLAVNRESRRAAERCYRVRVPYTSYGKVRYLLLCPELDILHIDTNDPPTVLVLLLIDIKSWDPQDVGVLSICVSKANRVGGPYQQDPHGFDLRSRMYQGLADRCVPELPTDPSPFTPGEISTFRTIITNLKAIYFYSPGIFHPRFEHHPEPTTANLRYPALYPLFAHSEAFDLLDSDPRPPGIDMHFDHLLVDPDTLINPWKEMECGFQIDRSQHTTPMYLLIAPAANTNVTLANDPPKIHTRKDVDSALRADAQVWAYQPPIEDLSEHWVCVKPETPETVKSEYPTPLPAVGFWLFAMSDLEKPPELAAEQRNWGPLLQRFFNGGPMRDFSRRQPKLGLFRLD